MKRLDEIEARTNAATEGPWEPPTPRMQHFTRADHEVNRTAHMSIPDAEFTAHARQDVPALVAALRAVLEVHRPISVTLTTQGGGVQTVTACDHTMDFYPCRTVRAIRQHLGEDA